MEERISSSGMSQYYQEGDYIVPSYSEAGRKLRDGKMYGDHDNIVRKSEMIATDALRVKGAALEQVTEEPAQAISKKKPLVKNRPALVPKTVKPTLKVDGFDNNTDTLSSNREYLPSLDIVFKMSLGKLKVTVVSASIEDRAICLVFKDENDLRFEPELGDKFNVIIDGATYPVFYPGFLFTWLDHKKRIMVLGRILEEENDEN